MVSQCDVTAVVLAGGRATRMGGIDKGLVTIANKSMIEHVLERLAPQVDYLLVNANRNIEQYTKLGYPVISDTLADYQGPLAGLLAGLHHCDTSHLITVPCDSPMPPLDYVTRMTAALNEADAEIAVATDGKRLQPVFCLLQSSLTQSLEAFLNTGDRKIDRWFAKHRYVEVSFSDQPHVFANINRPEELLEIEPLLL